ncbi:helix-turn-helix transcriptional regulator [Diaphorobacter sp.]|uniref:helix-turn-helix transcriptional regulator n=1 Tax=Diaphorobacter sp. TaxID=1934310 RepID=UPI003D14BDE8
MAFIEFDTRTYPRHERADAVRETCAALANMAPDVTEDGALSLAMRIRLLPGVSVAAVECSPLGVHRSARQLADGNDDVLLFLNPGNPEQRGGDGAWVVRQRGLGQQGEIASVDGAGCLALNERAGGIDFHGIQSKCVLIAFARERLLPQVDDVDRVLREGLVNTLPLRLLVRQALEMTRPSSPRDTSDAERLRLSDQLLDLGALALGATPQAQQRASTRGLRQARLKAIQADLRVHAWRGDLSLEWAAARHGISVRYVRALFEQEGTSFSDYLLEQRLQRAFGQLACPRHLGSTVSDIAYASGFNNLSWFYRAFKQRFSAAPSDIRQSHALGMSA